MSNPVRIPPGTVTAAHQADLDIIYTHLKDAAERHELCDQFRVEMEALAGKLTGDLFAKKATTAAITLSVTVELPKVPVEFSDLDHKKAALMGCLVDSLYDVIQGRLTNLRTSFYNKVYDEMVEGEYEDEDDEPDLSWTRQIELGIVAPGNVVVAV